MPCIVNLRGHKVCSPLIWEVVTPHYRPSTFSESDTRFLLRKVIQTQDKYLTTKKIHPSFMILQNFKSSGYLRTSLGTFPKCTVSNVHKVRLGKLRAAPNDLTRHCDHNWSLE